MLFASQVISNIITGKDVQSELIWACVAIIGACFGYNSLVAMRAISAKSQVASDVVKENPTEENADTSKEILSSDKP